MKERTNEGKMEGKKKKMKGESQCVNKEENKRKKEKMDIVKA